MSTILFPTDFSNDARNAFDYGISLFGNEHRYILFNAYEEPMSTATSMVSLRDVLQEASEDSLREELAFINEKYQDLNVVSVSEYGDPIFSVTNYAKSHSIDLIIMGTAGATGLQKIFLGSVATAVIEKASCPVIVVPKGYEFEPLRRVLFTTDLLNAEGDKLPQVLVELILNTKSQVTILTVNASGDEIDETRAESGLALHMSMHDFPHKFEVVVGEDIQREIQNFARENEMHLLVTTPRKSGWFQRLLNPSISKELAEHLEIPMFAIH
ncbi:MAG: universal stress protein [Cryomorphaceae bacterium]